MAKTKNAGAVSMQNVAAYAGVSIATVSKVMQGVSNVLPENVTKVQNAIEALGYRINPLGAELRRGRRNLVGVIVPTIEEPAIARLITELELKVELRGHVLFVASSHQSEAREAELAGRMIDWRVGGVIVVPVRGQRSNAALLIDDAQMPVVFIQHEAAERRFDTVSFGGTDSLTGHSPAHVKMLPIGQLATASVGVLFRRIDNLDEPPVVERVLLQEGRV